MAVTVLVEELQGADARVESALAALFIDVLFGITRQRTNQFDVVFFKKFRQIFHAGLKDHGQVAAVHHVASEAARGRDQTRKIRVQLRRAAGNVQSRNAAAREKTE